MVVSATCTPRVAGAGIDGVSLAEAESMIAIGALDAVGEEGGVEGALEDMMWDVRVMCKFYLLLAKYYS